MRHTIYIILALLLIGFGSAETQAQKTPAELRREARLFDRHTVRAGETAYSIARWYGISLPTLIEDNPGIDPTVLSIDQQLLIRKKEQGKTSPGEVIEQWEDLRDAATEKSDEYVFHIVKPGETLYSLSRMFGVTRAAIQAANDMKESDALRANSMIRIPAGGANSGKTAEGTIPDGTVQAVPGEAHGIPGWGGLFPSRHRTAETPNIALMLPLDVEHPGVDFVDFYKGALLALEDLKTAGRSMNVTLYNTGRSAEKVRETVSSAAFLNTDLIIGPVYENEMGPAVEFADGYKIPVVSPLATVMELDSPMLYQMAPDASTKYDKLRDLFTGGKNIILVSSGVSDDLEFEREITARLAGTNHGRFTIGGSGDMASLIDWNRENVFVVLADTELGVDKALTSIRSAYNDASERRSRKAAIHVVGSSRWAGFNSNIIDKNLFFNLNVCFVTSYYIDCSNIPTANFEGRYIETYGDFPSRSSYRGYDAVKLFAGALFEPGASFDEKLRQTTEGQAPLQIPYRFMQAEGRSRHVNDQWILVSFDSDYNVGVK